MDPSLSIDPNEEIKEKTPNYEKKERKDLSGGSKKKSGPKEKTAANWKNNPIYRLAQIKKPTRRNNLSPVNWSPRKKNESYLNRKIKHLQESGGMNNMSLDETLQSANLHFTRIAREKIAAKEAAKKAMEARKSAMVESSWCRILKEAGIKNKDSEKELENAKKRVSDEFENAKKLGVMMYDKPESRNRYRYEIGTDTNTGTHKIETCFETQFEVDKQVYNAIKNAFLELDDDDDNNKQEHKGLLCKIANNCEETGTGTKSFENKEEFKGLFCKIRENCEEIDTGMGLFGIWGEMGQTGLVGIMIERIKGLKKEELVSLAKIVATSGLNALLEGESVRLSVDEKYKLGLGLGFEETLKESNVPNLDKYLVKHVSKLERDVEEAKRQKGNNCALKGKLGLGFGETLKESNVPSLDKVLVKHVSKLEREIEEAKKNNKNNNCTGTKKDLEPEQSLDCILVKKHMSKLEREVYEAKNKNNNNNNLLLENGNNCTKINLEPVQSLDSVLVKKHMSKLEREVYEAKKNNNDNNNNNHLMENNINVIPPLPPRMTRLQKARLETLKVFNETGQTDHDKIEILKSFGEMGQTGHDKTETLKLKSEISERKKAKEREIMQIWGNLSLENSIQPRLSRIERDQIAWKKEKRIASELKNN